MNRQQFPKEWDEKRIHQLISDWEFLRLEGAVQNVDALIDLVGEDEAHPLAWLVNVLGILVQDYENQPVPEIAATREPV